MEIKCCESIDIKVVVDIFNRGFSDYVIQHTWSVEAFEERFLGPEGNTLKDSFIAFENGNAVGLMLGGIRRYDGIKTMRCGGMCLDPEYRGSGVARALFERHREHAVKYGCGQLFLEVIKGNDRAIKFYEKCGYDVVYNILYYSKDVELLVTERGASVKDSSYEFSEASITDLQKFRLTLDDCHMNWQCEPESFDEENGGRVMKVRLDNEWIARGGMSPSGKVYFLWVSPEHRRKGIGADLVARLASTQGIARVNFSTSNNSSCIGFARKLDFKRDTIEQFEMYLPL